MTMTGAVIRSGMWVFAANVSMNVVGYVFWVIASWYVTPNVVGSASAVLAIVALTTIITSLGLPTGLRRFVGEGRGREDYQHVSSSFFTALGLLTAVTLPVAVVLILLSVTQQQVLGLLPHELSYAGVLVLLSFPSSAFVSLFDSLMRTKTAALAQSLGSVLKLGLGMVFLVSGLGFAGIMVAFVFGALATDLVLFYRTSRVMKELSARPNIDTSLLQKVLVASLPAWAPNVLTIAGQSLAVLFIYSLVGSAETGLYYLAYAVSSLVYALPISVLGLMFPVLSGMTDFREGAISKMTRLALAATAPVAFIVSIYSGTFFFLLGPDYAQAATLLAILVLGSVVYPVYAGYYAYAYAIGKYSHVTFLGAVINVSRIVLYVLLVSGFGAQGIALSYVISIAISLPAVLVSSRILNFEVGWSVYAKTIIIPLLPSAALVILQVPLFLGAPCILLISLLLYARLRIVTAAELNEVAQGFVSNETTVKLYNYARPFLRILFGE